MSEPMDAKQAAIGMGEEPSGRMHIGGVCAQKGPGLFDLVANPPSVSGISNAFRHTGHVLIWSPLEDGCARIWLALRIGQCQTLCAVIHVIPSCHVSVSG